jgi:hypothetical protein
MASFTQHGPSSFTDGGDEGEDFSEFRFGEGGLLRRLELACRLTEPRAQIVTAIALTWLPIVLFGVYSEVVLGVPEPIVHDVAVHVRLLVATPILLVLDYLFPLVCRTALAQVSRQSFIREAERQRFDTMWRRVARLADSSVPELLIALGCLAIGVGVVVHQIDVRGVPEGQSLTPARFWYAMTDLPLFQFLLWRSVWRWMLWSWILIGLSFFRLDLVPTHPDCRGGIAFLRKPSIGYCGTLLFAISCVVVAEWGERFAGGNTLGSFRPLIMLFGVVGALVAFGPLLFYVPLLFRARYRAVLEASSFATQFARLFRVRRLELRGRELMTSRDVQGLTAMNASYKETVESMKLYLFYKKDIIILLAATLAPILPLTLVSVPAEEWQAVAKLLVGTPLP